MGVCCDFVGNMAKSLHVWKHELKSVLSLLYGGMHGYVSLQPNDFGYIILSDWVPVSLLGHTPINTHAHILRPPAASYTLIKANESSLECLAWIQKDATVPSIDPNHTSPFRIPQGSQGPLRDHQHVAVIPIAHIWCYQRLPTEPCSCDSYLISETTMGTCSCDSYLMLPETTKRTWNM